MCVSFFGGAEIYEERARKKQKAMEAAKKAKAHSQASMMQFLVPNTDDVQSQLPGWEHFKHFPHPYSTGEPELVTRQPVSIPPSPPIPTKTNVDWWIQQCGSDREVVPQTGLNIRSLLFCCSPSTGFPSSTCEQLWLKYGGKGPVIDRTRLLAVFTALKMNPTVDQFSRIMGV